MAGVLASVATAAEAERVAGFDIEVVDFKDPARGALGAWEPRALADARARVGGLFTSATVGDLPLEPATVRRAVERIAATGVDVVKFGLFAGALQATLRALEPLAAAGIRLAAVAFADRGVDPALVVELAAAGVRVLLVDTADKRAGPLTRHLSPAALGRVLDAARRAGMVTALAGSLGPAELARLAPLDPDLFGFRGALCAGGRSAAVDPARVRAVVETVRWLAPRRPDLSALRRTLQEEGDGGRRRGHVDGVCVRS